MAISQHLDPALTAAAFQCLTAHSCSGGGIEAVLMNIDLHSTGVIWAPARSSSAPSVLLRHSV
jgi:nicotinamide mononucleotide (NMN) deamidase PncC